MFTYNVSKYIQYNSMYFNIYMPNTSARHMSDQNQLRGQLLHIIKIEKNLHTVYP